MSDNQDQHRFQKDKDGFHIESTDPIQDVMNDDELAEAERSIQELIDNQEEG